MALAPLAGQISTLAVHHSAVVTLQESSLTQHARIDSISNEIQELRNEKRASLDIQEAVLKLQSEVEDIRNIYVKRVEQLERDISNCKQVVKLFMQEMERKYPVELED